MTKTITVRANRSFSTIKQGDVITIGEDDARLQAFLASGYLTEVEGDEAKGAKKVDALVENEPEIVWDGTPGNRRGTTVVVGSEGHADEKATATKSAPVATKGSNGTR